MEDFMSDRFFSKTGVLAIKQPQFKKIESTMKGGLAVASQRTEMISVPLVMGYKIDGRELHPGRHEVILRGDSGLAQWSKQIFILNGEEFVLCPESAVIGFVEKTVSGPQGLFVSVGGVANNEG
jgi:hypothetical protein